MKNYLLCIVVVFTTFQNFGQVTTEKYQRAKILYSETEALQRLESLGLPVDHGQHKMGYFVVSEFSEAQLEIARINGFQVEIIIEDVKEHFQQQNSLRLPERNLTCAESGSDYETPANFELGSMGGFLTYQEMLDELDQMRTLYPNLISAKSDINNFLTQGEPDNTTFPSIGGNGIKWVRISDNPDVEEGEPQILFSAIHHAREPMSLSQLIFYMWYLLENYDTDPEVKGIVDNSELYFIPVLNPDGYLYNERTDPNGGGFWRKNRRNNGNGQFGVDNNRNYQYFINGDSNNGMWGGEGSSGNPESDTYRGTTPFSEIENQAMKWFVEQHDFVMAFNNHSFGNLLLRPFGYAINTPSPDEVLLNALGAELVSKNGFNNILSSELYAAAGDSDDFMYGTVETHDKIYAYTPEIGPTFWPPSNQIVPIAKGMMYHNLTASKMINNYAAIKDTAPLFLGESFENVASFDLRRLGLSGNGSFTVTLEPVSSNIGTVGAPQVFSGVDLLATENGTITYFLTGAVTNGDEIIYDLVVNNGTFDTKLSVRKLFGELTSVFTDNGDSTTANFDNNGFGTTTQVFVSPSSSITDSPNGDYQNNTNESITLDSPIDLTGASGANVTFYAQWEIEDGFDYAQFQISIDDGNNWIAQCGNYTNPGSNEESQPTGDPLYDGARTDWVLEEIDLSDYLGETVLARFIIRSDGFLRQDGFYFDDLTFNIVEGILEVEDTAVANFNIFPNPVQDKLTINTNLSNYSIEIFTMHGQRVLQQESSTKNIQVDYSRFTTGLYIMKLTSGALSETFKIIKN
ncbi:M14 family zinc carboxypeptidase [Patiriisocius sp. Uisw_017]|jgi:hypothetical protein|uniref:M14 family zinc carboxypeptidase n=1 Tax=Patiriisocius sp. Uisw_017 TaxID=3230968 RepID=UPI0039EC6372